ncbi:alpha/beta fold hydrolase [Arsenicicoccus piscis]|uniref:alpha/beta fold hydrolase n=1 Tax=Arsenicicoccus piscis TaxID=673954 RepID=UPI0024E045CC|nr:alpha/beta hydrolase [Arsenicicoccus piscis]
MLGDAVATHVVKIGEGTPDVVVVPGTNFCAASSLALAEAAARHGTAWVVDVPGQPGLSSPLRSRRDTTAWYGSWLSALLDDTGASDLTLLGYSVGGAIALTAESPVVTRRLLVAPGGIVPIRPSARVTADATRWVMHATAASSLGVLRHMMAGTERPPQWAVEWMTIVGRACKSSFSPRRSRSTTSTGSPAPLVVAVGEQDTFVPPSALAASAKRRLGVDVSTIAGVGHLVPDDRWAAVVDDLFLA